ncbi:unnamed protein product [Rodentolepis nana]|uniref:Uncharacterized protein n=1 Tax=Rodentolepis nana TaxID=102285 RepID=A0A0R3TDG0_RODNA|nr:unnamed protein product [Rodentolepis nana]
MSARQDMWDTLSLCAPSYVCMSARQDWEVGRTTLGAATVQTVTTSLCLFDLIRHPDHDRTGDLGGATVQTVTNH